VWPILRLNPVMAAKYAALIQAADAARSDTAARRAPAAARTFYSQRYRLRRRPAGVKIDVPARRRLPKPVYLRVSSGSAGKNHAMNTTSVFSLLNTARRTG
jgi:hypothetical protein